MVGLDHLADTDPDALLAIAEDAAAKLSGEHSDYWYQHYATIGYDFFAMKKAEPYQFTQAPIGEDRNRYTHRMCTIGGLIEKAGLGHLRQSAPAVLMGIWGVGAAGE